jgi:hypothetical protein
MARNVANDLFRVQSRGSPCGGVGQFVTRHSDACKNLNCLVPRWDDRDVSRHRPRDHVKSGVMGFLILALMWDISAVFRARLDRENPANVSAITSNQLAIIDESAIIKCYTSY